MLLLAGLTVDNLGDLANNVDREHAQADTAPLLVGMVAAVVQLRTKRDSEDQVDTHRKIDLRTVVEEIAAALEDEVARNVVQRDEPLEVFSLAEVARNH